MVSLALAFYHPITANRKLRPRPIINEDSLSKNGVILIKIIYYGYLLQNEKNILSNFFFIARYLLKYLKSGNLKNQFVN